MEWCVCVCIILELISTGVCQKLALTKSWWADCPLNYCQATSVLHLETQASQLQSKEMALPFRDLRLHH